MLRALMAERMDPVLFGYSYDYVGDLAETVSLVWPDPPPHQKAQPRADARRRGRQAAIGQPLGRADRARPPARQRRHRGAVRHHQARHRRLAHRRFGPARQAGARRFRQGRRVRDRGALARAEAALHGTLRLAGRQGAKAGEGRQGAVPAGHAVQPRRGPRPRKARSARTTPPNGNGTASASRPSRKAASAGSIRAPATTCPAPSPISSTP